MIAKMEDWQQISQMLPWTFWWRLMIILYADLGLKTEKY